MLRRLALLVPSFCSLATGFAQSQQVPFTPESATETAWPAATVAAGPTRALQGEFTGDGNLDALFLAGSQALLQYAPAQHAVLIELPHDVVDAAVLKRSSAGEADALVLLGASGITLLEDYDAGSFTETVIALPATWDGAQRVGVHDLTGDGAMDLFGLAADGTTVLVALDVRSGPVVHHVLGLSAQVFDLTAIEWGGQAALVMNAADGLYVHRPTGELVESYTGLSSEAGFLTPVRTDGPFPDRVAVGFRSAGVDHFTTLAESGEDPISVLGAIGLYGGAAGDLDGDGLEDLVLLHTYRHSAGVLLQESGAGPSFPLLTEFDLGFGLVPAPDQTADPLLGDFDNDGDVDLLLHVALEDAVRLYENTTLAAEDATPSVARANYLYETRIGRGVLHLTTDVPSQAFDDTHLEFTVWTQPDSDLPLDPRALVTRRVAPGANGRYQVRFAVDEPDLVTRNIYWIVLRAVRWSGGVLESAGPASILAFSTPTAEVGFLSSQLGSPALPVQVQLADGGIERLTSKALDERSVSPSTVKGDKLPPSELPPDPFG